MAAERNPHERKTTIHWRRARHNHPQQAALGRRSRHAQRSYSVRPSARTGKALGKTWISNLGVVKKVDRGDPKVAAILKAYAASLLN